MTFCTSWLSLAMLVPPSQGAKGAAAWPVGDVVLVGAVGVVVPVAPVAEVDDVPLWAA